MTKSSNIVITSIILVCRQLNFALFDPGITYSYVSAYYEPGLELSWYSLFVSLCVFTNVGYSLVVD